MKTLDISKPALTSRQKEIYEFLREKILTRGYGPTVREIGMKFDIKSPNGVMCHLKALERKGMISRESHMSRAIQLANPPQHTTKLPFMGELKIGDVFPTSNASDQIDFSELFNSLELFCMKASGSELADELIGNGDLLVIHRQPTFDDGDLSIVVFENGKTGLRRLYQESGQIRLELPRSNENPQFVSRIVVIGKLIGVIRIC
jgi:repressor LexA